MFRRFQLTAVLLAWLLATGSQWDLAQTFAWGRMIATRAHTVPLIEAVRLTFTPGNECEVCDAVNAAKQQQDNPATPSAKAPGKLLLVLQPTPAFVIAVPEFSPWSLSDFTVPDASRAAPPLPPPRAA
jgi:hypothetical protein